MKYLVAVDDCFLDRPGGMGRVAWDIAALMRDRGHEVTMVAAHRRPGGNGPSVRCHEGIRVLRYSRPLVPAWHPLRARRTMAAADAATREHFGGERWDVVHMHSPFTGAGVLQALGNKPRYIYTLHSPIVMEQQINWAKQGALGRFKLIFARPTLKRWERRVLEPCQRIHTLSKYSRDAVERQHGLGSRVVVVPHWRRPELRRECSKSEARRRLGWPADETILFTVRKLGPRYGLEVAIRAVAPLVSDGRCRLIIGGDGPLRAALEKLARSLSLAERVWFTGRLDEEQLRLAYQAADLFLLPTLALECFGLITIESLAFGCPVLSSDAGAIPEVMRPILPDFIVPAGDEVALRGKVEQFVAGRLTPPPPEELVAYVDGHFSKDLIAPRIVKLLENGPSAWRSG